jgi:gas vesicle protein
MDDMTKDDMTNSKFVTAGYFWAGIGLGAIAGILLAPKSGSETREQVTRKFQEGKDYAQRKAREIQARAEDLVETGRQTPERIAAAFEAGRDAYNQEMARTH